MPKKIGGDVYARYFSKLAKGKRGLTQTQIRQEKRRYTAHGDKFWALFRDLDYSKIKKDKKAAAADEVFRTRLQDENCEDVHGMIRKHLWNVFNNPKHPLCRLLHQFANLFHAQYSFSPEMWKFKSSLEALARPGVSPRSAPPQQRDFMRKVKKIVSSARDDVKQFILRCTEVLCKDIFPGLQRSQCVVPTQSAIHDSLFRKLAPTLYDLYKIRNRLKDYQVAFGCGQLRKITLTDLGVPPELALGCVVAKPAKPALSRARTAPATSPTHTPGGEPAPEAQSSSPDVHGPAPAEGPSAPPHPAPPTADVDSGVAEPPKSVDPPLTDIRDPPDDAPADDAEAEHSVTIEPALAAQAPAVGPTSEQFPLSAPGPSTAHAPEASAIPGPSPQRSPTISSTASRASQPRSPHQFPISMSLPVRTIGSMLLSTSLPDDPSIPRGMLPSPPQSVVGDDEKRHCDEPSYTPSTSKTGFDLSQFMILDGHFKVPIKRPRLQPTHRSRKLTTTLVKPRRSFIQKLPNFQRRRSARRMDYGEYGARMLMDSPRSRAIGRNISVGTPGMKGMHMPRHRMSSRPFSISTSRRPKPGRSHSYSGRSQSQSPGIMMQSYQQRKGFGFPRKHRRAQSLTPTEPVPTEPSEEPSPSGSPAKPTSMLSQSIERFRKENPVTEPIPPPKPLLSQVSTLSRKAPRKQSVVRRRERLQPSRRLDSDGNPYLKAIKCLARIVEEHTPEAKIRCIVQTSTTICQCVDDYYARAHPIDSPDPQPDRKQVRINADDLLALFAYVVVRANLPTIVSETDFINDFVVDSLIKGEPGYFLAVLQSAAQHICSAKDELIAKNEAALEQSQLETAGGSAEQEPLLRSPDPVEDADQYEPLS